MVQISMLNNDNVMMF